MVVVFKNNIWTYYLLPEHAKIIPTVIPTADSRNNILTGILLYIYIVKIL